MRLLVIRTSAMGDVALTAPVLKGMREQYPETELTLLTRSAYKPFFSSISGLDLFPLDLKNRHKGFIGLLRLFRDLNRQARIDYVIDLHDVLRSKILRFFFRLSGVPVAVIDKGRKGKRLLRSGKEKIQQKHSVERYCDVFAQAGFPVIPSSVPSIGPKPGTQLRPEFTDGMRGVINIGVAPYAKHELKMWPEDNMIRLLELFSQNHNCRFWLFGGMEDKDRLTGFEMKVVNSTNLAGRLSLDEELLFMSSLDFMIAMDSSNMHMAALVGTKVFSIWGGTDPLNGFYAWQQPESFSLRIPVDELTCRPCTTFGKGKCKRGDFACMNWLTPELVFRKIENFMSETAEAKHKIE
jgi:ADP-heptose:LPS heptosyltransferase